MSPEEYRFLTGIVERVFKAAKKTKLSVHKAKINSQGYMDFLLYNFVSSGTPPLQVVKRGAKEASGLPGIDEKSSLKNRLSAFLESGRCESFKVCDGKVRLEEKAKNESRSNEVLKPSQNSGGDHECLNGNEPIRKRKRQDQDETQSKAPKSRKKQAIQTANSATQADDTGDNQGNSARNISINVDLGKQGEKADKKSNGKKVSGKTTANQKQAKDATREPAKKAQKKGRKEKKSPPKSKAKDGQTDGPGKGKSLSKPVDQAGDNEVLEAGEDLRWRGSRERPTIKHGRFSTAEIEALRSAAEEYARENNMSDTDFDWMFSKGKGKKKGASAHWPILTERALPHRSVRSVYNHGLRLFGNYKKGKWTGEEDKQLLEMVESKGKKWREISDELGRLPLAARDRYRDLVSMSDVHQSGRWTAEECGLLEEAVNEYLQNKQDVENQQTAALSLDDLHKDAPEHPTPQEDSRSRVLLDDINWSWVAEKVGTRSRRQCLTKWYNTLSPSMVSTGEWGIGDDRRLLKGILLSEAAFYFQVPWDDVVSGRTAKQAKRRWALMVKRVPDHQEKEFHEQVSYLVETFAPGLKQKVSNGIVQPMQVENAVQI